MRGHSRAEQGAWPPLQADPAGLGGGKPWWAGPGPAGRRYTFRRGGVSGGVSPEGRGLAEAVAFSHGRWEGESRETEPSAAQSDADGRKRATPTCLQRGAKSRATR